MKNNYNLFLFILLIILSSCGGDDSKKSSYVFQGVYKSEDIKIDLQDDEFTYSKYKNGRVVKEIKGKFEQHTSDYFNIDPFGEKKYISEETFLVLKNKSFKTWFNILNPRQDYYYSKSTNYLESIDTYIDHYIDSTKDCYDPYFENLIRVKYIKDSETKWPFKRMDEYKLNEGDGILILTNQGAYKDWGGLVSFYHSYDNGNVSKSIQLHFTQ